MKKIDLLFITGLLVFPTVLLADINYSQNSIQGDIIILLFLSTFSAVGILLPLTKKICKDNVTKTIILSIIIRAVIVTFLYFCISKQIFIYDIVLIFIGTIIVKKMKALNLSDTENVRTNCLTCGYALKPNDNFCENCGAQINELKQVKTIVHSTDFDPIYRKNEKYILKKFINNELVKIKMEDNKYLLPESMIKKKNLLNTIFSILLFIYIVLIFLHINIFIIIFGFIILLVLYISIIQTNITNYFSKEIKSRPREKIADIISTSCSSFVNDRFKTIRLISIAVAIIIPLIVFFTPRIIYSEVDGGYAVRYYITGLNSLRTATIPKIYNNKKIVSIRGDAFSNMIFLKTVNLPDTITEIKGKAFKNDFSLKNINIPKKIMYIGGGTFYNCISIENIILPDSLTFLGGESFYNAISLKNIKLSANLTEIRGDTFKNCRSLSFIDIPDNVTRIAAHSFQNNYFLSNVFFTNNSKLKEIGSSAFRNCSNLNSITIPNNVLINERAFKESPTHINYFNNQYNWEENNYYFQEDNL